MALFDLFRARRSVALIVAAFATLPVIQTNLPGDALHRLRSDRSLRTLTGLYERVTHGAADLVSADLPWRAPRPFAAFVDWLAWQWFGLEAWLHRLALLALLALVARGLRAPSREGDEVVPALLGAALVAHPVSIDLLASLRGREVVFALAAGVLASGLLADAASRRSALPISALGAFAVGGSEPAFLPWFAGLALAASRGRRSVVAGLAVGLIASSSAALRWPAAPTSAALASVTWRSLRVAAAPVALDVWATLSATSWALAALAALAWAALAALAWRRGARVEAIGSSLLLVGAVLGLSSRGAATGARVDAELLAAVFALLTLAGALLGRTRRGPHLALAYAAVVTALGVARAAAWRDEGALARAAITAHPRDGRAALLLAWHHLRAGQRDAGCRAAVADRAVRAPALACLTVEAALAGRLDEARGTLDAYRATPGAERRLAWDFGRALSLRPVEERNRLRRSLGLPPGGAQ